MASTTGGHPSPSSSPRLPSPPPMAEDQTAPQSPLSSSTGDDPVGLYTPAHLDISASRRVRPGTKSADISEGPPLVELADIESPFQLTEHLKAVHHHHTHTHPPSSPRTIPLTRHTASLLAEGPAGVDRPLWLYELCRFLVAKANIFVGGLFTDSPPCSASTCHEMRASEWQYLCAVHDPPKSCCAIDYCCHTLDWAANTLSSPRHFPSRLSLEVGRDSSSVGGPGGSQMRQLTNIFRRVYRIFAHAWFQHREVFWRVESRTGLYCLFKTVCDVYQLVPEDNYTIPPEAEGLEDHDGGDRKQEAPAARATSPKDTQRPVSMLRRDDTTVPANPNASDLASQPGATARRHKHTPSKGAPVDTVPEENEEEESTSGLSSISSDAAAAADQAGDVAQSERRSALIEPHDDTDLAAEGDKPDVVADAGKSANETPAAEPTAASLTVGD